MEKTIILIDLLYKKTIKIMVHKKIKKVLTSYKICGKL